MRSAADGELALAGVKDKLPALILLDILLPGVDGYEICRILKDSEDTKDIPIIFISGRTDPVDKVKAFGFGAVDYFSKPFEMEEVLAWVATHLSMWDAKKEIEASNKKLIDMIETTAKFAKLESVGELDFVKMDVATMFKNVVDNFRPKLEGKQILLEFKAEGEYLATVSPYDRRSFCEHIV